MAGRRLKELRRAAQEQAQEQKAPKIHARIRLHRHRLEKSQCPRLGRLSHHRKTSEVREAASLNEREALRCAPKLEQSVRAQSFLLPG